MQNRSAAIIALVVLALLLLCCCVATVVIAVPLARNAIPWGRQGGTEWAWSFGRERVTDTFARELRVDSPTTVVVHGEVGNITIRTGNDGVVNVEAELEAKAYNRANAEDLLRRLNVSATSSGGEAIIETSVPDGLMDVEAGIHLTVTVPREARLDIRNGVGDIRIQGVEGAIEVTNGVGKIALEATQSSVVVRNGVGDISLDDARGSAEVHAGTGGIDYQGQLPNEGEVALDVGVGDIRLELPDDSAFTLNATTGAGDIDSDFDVREQGDGEDSLIGDKMQGSVGAAPRVALTLHTGTGNIDIRGRR